MHDSTEAAVVKRVLEDEILENYASVVDVVRTWIESPNSVCIVYRRRLDGDHLIGQRFRFPPHAANDDPVSTGVDAALNTAEPLGAPLERARLAGGVFWFAIPPTDALPSIPDGPSAPSRD
ncbi:MULTISPECIES: hypothetical protein [unclassified Rathayibacter]|uniref:hypothetical protein n=1 Tax=unclassified Rathayibacter TaxID=2609250 RepID=UPI000CE92F60|nr:MULTISPECIES: hypothetical protein [unclassified Rathayibacter]PPI40885.1 hypothetical protein C5D50_04980 [Rathayibacter sp. RFBD1]PPI60337.1 hypothetical protein C5D38_04710 [Rathayibacter sp. TRS19]